MKNVLLSILGILALTSCNKDEILQVEPPIDTRKIYVAGYEKNPSSDGLDRAKYWVNGTEFLLTNGETASKAYSITTGTSSTTGNQVFVAGYEYVNDVMKARIWRDKIPLTVQTGTVQSAATGVCTLNNDYYACGIQSNNFGTQAVYWKNGLQTFLTSENAFAYATAICTFNNDIYIAGYIKNGDLNKAVYWKNNEAPVYLNVNTTATYNSTADAIVVKNNKVYVAGNFEATISQTGNIPMFWVDGVNDAFDLDYAGAVLTSIAVDDAGSIFLAGSKIRGGNPVGVVWKNKIEEPFETTSVNSRVESLFLTNNNFYKAGFSDGVKATYWQATNGRQVLDTKISYAKSIFVTEF
jgi:hypothetical protein